MKELSNVIFEGLKSANIKNIGKRVYPIVASKGAKFPFITYHIKILKPETKDRARDYYVDVVVYEEDYKETVEMMDEIINDVMPDISHNAKEYRFSLVSADVKFSDKDNVFFGIITFKIVK